MNGSVSFSGRPGPNIVSYAEREFCGNKQKLDKYVRLYSDTFFQNIDKKTIVDLGVDNKYVLSNENFPDIKYISDSRLYAKTNILESLLQECSLTLSRAEIGLFRKIISESVQRGVTIEELSKVADKIKTEKSKKYFVENLELAKAILKNDKNSKLASWEFDMMLNSQLEKEANTEGTELYDLIHNFNGLVFDA